MGNPSISDLERRRRIGLRHRLAPSAKSDDVVAIAESVVGLHSSDPVTVHLSAAARMSHPRLPAVTEALYDDHRLIRHHAMRRTLWVMTPQTTRLAHAAATTRVFAAEWRRVVALVQAGGVADDGEAWLRAACQDTLAVVERLGEAGARRIGQEVPHLAVPISMAPGNRFATTPSAHTRVLLLLGFAGQIVRGRPTGTWINGQYSWRTMERTLPGGMGETDPAEARAELVRCWLRAFGPALPTDLQWWLGATAAHTKAALDAVGAVPVNLENGVGVVLPEDLGVSEQEPWVALLPALDPTTMGWQQRGFYLGPHAARLFDRNGNAGPTIWVDGQVVGCWAQRPNGEIVTQLLDELPARRRREIDEAATGLRRLLDEVRFSVRFSSPLATELRGPG